jgi:RNA polymerase sigma-70 factor (ECF subfamily)
MASDIRRTVPWPGRALHVVPQSIVPVPTDEELIEAVLRGDDQVASALYRKLFPMVDRALCRLFAGRDIDHDDLVQSAFEQIVHSIASRKYRQMCSLSAWASAVTTNVGLAALRARCRERRVVDRKRPEDDAADPARTAHYEIDGQIDAREGIKRVHSVLGSMNPARAEILFLHDVAGHDLGEISAMIGASVAAVQSRLVRGRRELFVRLAELAGSRGDAR